MASKEDCTESTKLSIPHSPASSEPLSSASSEPLSPASSEPFSQNSSVPHSPNSSEHPSPTSSANVSSSDSEEESAEILTDDNEDSNPFSDDLFSPLYTNSKTTICGAFCAIMHFATSNMLPYAAIEELLKLLQLLCPQPNHLPTSLYKLKKFFKAFRGDYEKSHVCTICFNQCSGIPDCDCQQTKEMGHLVHIDIGKSIKTLITNHWNDLNYPQSFQEKEDSVIFDIWSGDILNKEIQSGRFFSYREHLMFSIFTDGIPLFKSSCISLWPVYLVVNNLPPSIRMCSSNVILCGLWCGPGKPPIHYLLEPIRNAMKSLVTVGLTLLTPNGLKTIRGKVLMGIFDLPAKALVLNCKQFNGEYGCTTCLHPGRRLPNGARIFEPSVSSELRTNSSVLSDARKAEESGHPEMGIKGLSVLANVLDLVNGVPVDYMHAILEGVTRWLLRAWFEPCNFRKPFYIRKYLPAIDKSLLSQHPPHEFSRPPRAITTHVKYWKASEIRSWLLYYALPLVQNYLPPLYIHHFSLLVCVMHILLQDRIPLTLLDASTEMIQDFVTMLPELYGEMSCTANAHALSHIPMYVKLWGPLWTHSAFGFESKNGHLKSLFHGKSSITDQIVFVTDVIQTLQIIQNKLDEQESEDTLDYISKITGRAPRTNMINQGESIYSIGKIEQTELSVEFTTQLSLPTTASVFKRAHINGTIYYSKSYLRGQGKRDSSVCMFLDSSGNANLGEIELFLLASEPLAIVRAYKKYPHSYLQQAGNPCRPALDLYRDVDLLDNYIHAVDKHQYHLCKVSLKLIIKKAILISVHTLNCNYVVSQPNKFEFH